ncbi:TetR/AcrR family transcriptional regulator [Variovorax paradoxus]|nr:TetR/AcrR family transcriptional regulator [Variovorax paradoxus]MBT2299587.1 TetR/AcrR family transcriptional regulator [Variovorax paradoxus]
MNLTVKPRRKPSQARAWMTSRAIQDAFVLLLLERGYEKVSMRHIAAVAGVGLGTLYQYFPGKDSIAAVTVRSRLRGLAALVEEAGAASSPRTLEQTVHALAQALVGTLLSQAAEWRALFVLERRISSSETYRELYKRFVHLFRDAFASASDWPAAFDRERVALNAFSIVDAMAKHALLVQESCPDADKVVEDVECAVNGYFLLERKKRGAARAA